MSSNQRSSLCYLTDYNIIYIFNIAEYNKNMATSFLNKWSGIKFYDWKPVQSIIDILCKDFQEDHINPRRFPGGFLNSNRIPEFPGVVDTQISCIGELMWLACRLSRSVVCSLWLGDSDWERLGGQTLSSSTAASCPVCLASSSNTWPSLTAESSIRDDWPLAHACRPPPTANKLRSYLPFRNNVR